ncbi:MAG: YihY/virulence factor BrkB family protein [Steroidobacteraceae bacterium]
MWAKFWSFLDDWFFGGAGRSPVERGPFIRGLSYVYAVVRDLLTRGEINLRAMSLVYTTLLTLIPLAAFSFAILKLLGAGGDLAPVVYQFFSALGPQEAPKLTSRVVLFANRIGGGLLGSVGLALLAVTLIITIKKVEDSFNFLWRVQKPRSLARRVTEYLTLLVVGPILLVMFIGLSHRAIDSAPFRDLRHLPLLDILTTAGIKLAPYVMGIVFFTGLYILVPNTRVRLRPALIGAVVAGILWAAVGHMFTAFVVHSPRLAIVYAGFAFIVAALLWTYSGWLILLAGALLSFYVQNPAYLRLGLQALELSGAEVERLSLRVMYLVGRAYLTGERRWRLSSLAAELGLPSVAVAETVLPLERAGILLVTEEDELVPARDLGHITVAEILEVARNRQTGDFNPRVLPIAPVDRLLGAIDEARRGRCGDLTLRDLVQEPPRATLVLASGNGP